MVFKCHEMATKSKKKIMMMMVMMMIMMMIMMTMTIFKNARISTRLDF